MKLSEQWLREWANPQISSDELAARITMAGLEVDGITPVAGKFNNIIVARVNETRKHPQADKLTLCEVDNGQIILQAVCGAANVRPGLKVALAQVGTIMPSGMKIKESKLRGELSQGMLCSASELGLAESSDGILELAEDAPVGVDIRTYLNLDDHSIDIDLTPNRADCFSVLGIAREVAAITGMTPPSYEPSAVSPEQDDSIPVKIEAIDGCTNYQCRLIKGIRADAKSPVWLTERLRRSGIRSIHPVVDVTNYVMLECGQPMHAFDARTIQGSICVRYAREKEPLVLLDEQEKILNTNVLVIADDTNPLAMAGVMGGNSSAVQEGTSEILLESAWFHPEAIAGIARMYGLCTDSSQRFERGVDPSLQTKAIEKATALILDICGGKAGPISGRTLENHIQERADIKIDPAKVMRLTGVSIELDEMHRMLEGLGMQVERTAEQWKVKVPAWRFDIDADVDLVEEVIRLYGYDKISGMPMKADVRSGQIDKQEELAQRLTRFFVARGYHETISYSFVDPDLQSVLYPEQQALSLLNPISSELSQMRMGLWPGLLASLLHNAHRQHHSLKLFETGVRFVNRNNLLQEETVFAGLLAGSQAPYSWCESDRSYDFFDAKGDLQALFDGLGLDAIHFEAATHPALHPGQCAKIMLNDHSLGFLGILHPAVTTELELQYDVIVFEFELSALLKPTAPKYCMVSKFPAVRRDLSLLAKETVRVQEIETVVREVIDSSLLKSFNVFDVYRGESLPQGHKSLAISLEMQDAQRTLVDDEINNKISAILQILDERLSIKLRE